MTTIFNSLKNILFGMVESPNTWWDAEMQNSRQADAPPENTRRNRQNPTYILR